MIRDPSDKLLSITVAKAATQDGDLSFFHEMEGCLSKGSVIIYVWRKKDAEVLTEHLMCSGVAGGVVCYHGEPICSVFSLFPLNSLLNISLLFVLERGYGCKGKAKGTNKGNLIV